MSLVGVERWYNTSYDAVYSSGKIYELVDFLENNYSTGTVPRLGSIGAYLVDFPVIIYPKLFMPRHPCYFLLLVPKSEAGSFGIQTISQFKFNLGSMMALPIES